MPVGNQISVGTYKVNGDGTLSLVSNSEVTTGINSSAALAFDPTGTYLAVAGTGGLQLYSLGSDGTLTQSAAPQDIGVNFVDVAWDDSNHVFATASSQLYVFTSASGALTAAPGSPHSGGSALAVLPLH